MSTKQYVKNLFKDPHIASITPTSKSGVKDVCSRMNLDKKVVIVEYGPALGVFTQYLLDNMTDDSLMIAIELNEDFIKELQQNFSDKRLKIHHDSAENVDTIMKSYRVKADYIISGIPFSLMPSNLRESIVKKTNTVLKEGGKFLPYQTFFQKDKHLLDYLKNHFSHVNDYYFMKNIPPMRIYEATK